MEAPGTPPNPFVSQTRTNPLKRVAQLFAVALLLCATLSFLLFALNVQIKDKQINVDFAIFYTAGRIVAHGNPHQLYDMQLQRQVQRQLVRRNQFRPYYHPPFEAWFFAPFASLPFQLAFLLWAACNTALFILALFLLHQTGYHLETRSLLVWAAAAIPPLSSLFLIGQDSLLLVTIFLLALLALKKSREYAAGFLLGLGLFNFQVVLPFVLVFLLRRRFKLFVAFLGSAFLVSAISLATVGWAGIGQYTRVILHVAKPAGDQLSGSVAAMVTVRAFLATLLHGLLPGRLIFILVLAVTLFLLFMATRLLSDVAEPETRAFDLEFSLCLLVALSVSYHLFQYSLSPLIVAAFLMLAYEDAAHSLGSLHDNSCTVLLILFAGVSIALGYFHLPQNVISIVLLGLIAWLSQEIGALRKATAFGGSAA